MSYLAVVWGIALGYFVFSEVISLSCLCISETLLRIQIKSNWQHATAVSYLAVVWGIRIIFVMFTHNVGSLMHLYCTDSMCGTDSMYGTDSMAQTACMA